MEPAIRHASRGFTVTPYLSECIDEALPDLVLDPVISGVYLQDGRPITAGAPNDTRIRRNTAPDRVRGTIRNVWR